MRRPRRAATVLAALGGLVTSVSSFSSGFVPCGFVVEAQAQGLAMGSGRMRTDDDVYDEEQEIPGRGTLRGSFGVPVAERLLSSSNPEERLRGIRRLGAIGTPEAIDALVDGLEQSSILARDPRARLEAMRALAEHATKENVRPLLVRELSEAGPDGRAAIGPLGALARGAAALSLAKSGDKKALLALFGAVANGGPGGEAAAEALVVYPPASLGPLLEGKRRLEPTLSTMLADGGELRGLDKLHTTLEEGDLPAKTAAALALARLGDATPKDLALTWVKGNDPKLQRIGAEVLVRLGADAAIAAVNTLFATNATRADGVRLALVFPRPEFVEPLVKVLDSLGAEDKDKAIAAIGRIGGRAAAEALLTMLAKPELGTAAAFALSRMPGQEGKEALSRALASTSAQKGGPRRLITRAAVVRAIVMGEEPSGLGDTLKRMAAEKDAADRAVSLFGRVATGRTNARDAVAEACSSGKTCELVLVAALARALLARGPEGLSELGPLLSQAAKVSGDEPSLLAIASGVFLLAEPSSKAVPTTQLLRWAEGGGPLAPLAARALPSRDDESTRARIKRLLEGTDPVIRAHAALGLAFDPEPDATSLLVMAYRFEEDAEVRRAVVRALSERKEPQRQTTLREARDLDPDDGVRALARAALRGRSLAPLSSTPGGSVVWISLIANAPSALASIEGRAGRLVRSDGLVVPLVADPDGVILVPTLAEGRSRLTLAPEAALGDAHAP